MIRIFYGKNGVKAFDEIDKILGKDKEVVEGVDLMAGDLPSLFMGVSLLAEKRKILVRDFAAVKDNLEKLPEYVQTPHEVILLENDFKKNTKLAKELAAAGVEMKKFDLEQKVDPRATFNILDTALRDGPKAVAMLEKVEAEQDPYMFVGLMASQAVKKYAWRQGAKEKRVLKELSKLDIDLKESPISSQPWLLIHSFLLRVSSL